VFPLLIFKNLRKLDSHYLKLFNWETGTNCDFLPIARCVCYHIGTAIEKMTFINMDLFPHYPLLSEEFHDRVKMLRFLALAESDCNYRYINYLTFSVREDLPIGRNLYIWGLDHEDQMFHAFQVECKRMKRDSPKEIMLSKRAKLLLRSNVCKDQITNNAINCFIASYFGSESENMASQIINLEAGFECLIRLQKDEGKSEFAERIANYYAGSVIIRNWAHRFYELRSNIHHGFKDRNGLVINSFGDYCWKDESNEIPINKMVHIGRKVFYDILMKEQINTDIFPDFLENILTSNKNRYYRLIEILRQNRKPNTEFIRCVNDLNPNDTSGNKEQFKNLAILCLKYFADIDESYNPVFNEITRKSKTELLSILPYIRDSFINCSKLKYFCESRGFMLLDKSLSEHRGSIQAALDLIDHLGHTAIVRWGNKK